MQCNVSDLNRNQRRAIDALMRTSTVRDAANRCGLSESTMWRYLGEPNFEACLAERQDKATAGLAAALCGLTDEAIATLRALLADTDGTPPTVRARVALGVLKERRDVIELKDVVERVQEVEQLVEEDRESIRARLLADIQRKIDAEGDTDA